MLVDWLTDWTHIYFLFWSFTGGKFVVSAFSFLLYDTMWYILWWSNLFVLVLQKSVQVCVFVTEPVFMCFCVTSPVSFPFPCQHLNANHPTDSVSCYCSAHARSHMRKLSLLQTQHKTGCSDSHHNTQWPRLRKG